MQLNLVTTAALLAVAATLCAADPLPPPHRTPKELEEYHKATTPLKAKSDLSPGDGGVKANGESGHPEQPGLNTPNPVDTNSHVQPPSDASKARNLPDPGLTPEEIQRYAKYPQALDIPQCTHPWPFSKEDREKVMRAHKLLEEEKLRSGLKANEEPGHPEQTGKDAPGPVDLKQNAQPSNPSGPADAIIKRRWTADHLPVLKLSQEEMEYYAEDPSSLDVPRCIRPRGFPKEDREKDIRALKLLEEKARGHGGAKPSRHALPPGYAVWPY
jgi:hypothetical protein